MWTTQTVISLFGRVTYLRHTRADGQRVVEDDGGHFDLGSEYEYMYSYDPITREILVTGPCRVYRLPVRECPRPAQAQLALVLDYLDKRPS